jgi:hypothetical protein
MSIISEIKAIIGVELHLKGIGSDIIKPVQRLLTLIDEDLITMGVDFVNPLIEVEYQKLLDAIAGEEEEIGMIVLANQVSGTKEIILGLTDQDDDDDDDYDDTAFLDED